MGAYKSFKLWLANLPWAAIFQRLPGIWLLSMIPFGIIGPLYLPALYSAYLFLLHFFYLVNNVRSAYAMFVTNMWVRHHSKTDWKGKTIKHVADAWQKAIEDGTGVPDCIPYESIRHVIIIPNYKEELEVLHETLSVLASHPDAAESYLVCLAMEEGEAGSAEKAQSFIDHYTGQFLDMTYSMHPRNIPNEIRGKSSNTAWAAKHCYEFWSENRECQVITVMDADTCFAADYFTAVNYYFSTAPTVSRRLMMFAPNTLFDRNANQVPAFVRINDIFWCTGVISNSYPSSPISFPCSAYSMSMSLCKAVNFWDAGPDAIGEDLHMYLKCFYATKGRVIVQSIYSPASQCNVAGEGTGWAGFKSNMHARYIQAKRHLWGSLDSGWILKRSMLKSYSPECLLEEEASEAAKIWDAQFNQKMYQKYAEHYKIQNSQKEEGTRLLKRVKSSLSISSRSSRKGSSTDLRRSNSAWSMSAATLNNNQAGHTPSSHARSESYLPTYTAAASSNPRDTTIPIPPSAAHAQRSYSMSTQNTYATSPSTVSITGSSKPATKEVPFRKGMIMALFHRMFEAHILMGHFFTLLMIAAIIIPIRSTSINVPTSIKVWNALSPNKPVAPILVDVYDVCFFLRLYMLPPFIFLIVYYEKYHHWLAVERWRLQDEQKKMGVDHGIQPLGIRAELVATRKYPWAALDWPCIIPSVFMFYIVPQYVCQVGHLWTNSLEYVVAKKATGAAPPAASPPASAPALTA
ncbi:hypothetical protein HDV05_005223 [Chytridiales sp. JEL 0842]|nr:hypothetical protein HDV05_005223 [Chytridiales sp. JEL 0842]